MKDNYNRPKETRGTAELSQCTQSLMEEIGAKDSTVESTNVKVDRRKQKPHSPYQDAKRTQGSDKDSRRKRIRCEIANFAEAHYKFRSASSIAQATKRVRIPVHVTTPPHHIGLFR